MQTASTFGWSSRTSNSETFGSMTTSDSIHGVRWNFPQASQIFWFPRCSRPSAQGHTECSVAGRDAGARNWRSGRPEHTSSFGRLTTRRAADSSLVPSSAPLRIPSGHGRQRDGPGGEGAAAPSERDGKAPRPSPESPEDDASSPDASVRRSGRPKHHRSSGSAARRSGRS